jgi:uncharacterized protein (DUF849 family)
MSPVRGVQDTVDISSAGAAVTHAHRRTGTGGEEPVTGPG